MSRRKVKPLLQGLNTCFQVFAAAYLLCGVAFGQGGVGPISGGGAVCNVSGSKANGSVLTSTDTGRGCAWQEGSGVAAWGGISGTLSNQTDLNTALGLKFPIAGGTLTGNLLFTDASFDIGATGATRPRDLFLSRNAVIGGTLNLTGHATLEGVTSTGATGTGAIVFGTSPTLGTPNLGVPSAIDLTHATNVPGFVPGAAALTGPGVSGTVSQTPGANGIPQLDGSGNLAVGTAIPGGAPSSSVAIAGKYYGDGSSLTGVSGSGTVNNSTVAGALGYYAATGTAISKTPYWGVDPTSGVMTGDHGVDGAFTFFKFPNNSGVDTTAPFLLNLHNYNYTTYSDNVAEFGYNCGSGSVTAVASHQKFCWTLESKYIPGGGSAQMEFYYAFEHPDGFSIRPFTITPSIATGNHGIRFDVSASEWFMWDPANPTVETLKITPSQLRFASGANLAFTRVGGTAQDYIIDSTGQALVGKATNEAINLGPPTLLGDGIHLFSGDKHDGSGAGGLENQPLWFGDRAIQYTENVGFQFQDNATGALHTIAGVDTSLQLSGGTMSGALNLGTQVETISIPNAGSTGTTVNKLAKLTGAPSTAVIAGTSDTSGIVGIVASGAGTTGTALISRMGEPSCVFDGATTAGHYVQISPTVAGDCHDFGAGYPTSGQVLGWVLSTNGGAGTYPILMRPDIVVGAGSTQWTTTGSDIYYGTGSVGIGSTTSPMAPLNVEKSSFTSNMAVFSNGVTGTPPAFPSSWLPTVTIANSETSGSRSLWFGYVNGSSWDAWVTFGPSGAFSNMALDMGHGSTVFTALLSAGTTLQLGGGSDGTYSLLDIKSTSVTIEGSLQDTLHLNGTAAITVDAPGVGGGRLNLDSSGNFKLPLLHSTTGTRYVCVDTTGLLSSSASACSGT